ncbi:Emopamil-binding protein [Lasallia pustulata]|uniref:Emopamil-binding protein n=1 Tax=Lasallia pustulata TaxID=136370 RepID=A0A1W5D8H8_9LECA|nr:Emopamil-binding protein [Lasallia pustulata]
MTTPLLTTTTLLSLTLTLLLLLLALLLSRLLLPPSTPRTLRTLYIWHLFSSLTHLLLEGSFLYNCFFTYTVLPPRTPDYPHPASVGIGAGRSFTHAPFLGHADRAYGSAYGSNAFARLWQEYAKADRRWGGADLGVVAVEVVTVSYDPESGSDMVVDRSNRFPLWVLYESYANIARAFDIAEEKEVGARKKA